MSSQPQFSPEPARDPVRARRTARPDLSQPTEPVLPTIGRPMALPTPTLKSIAPDEVLAIHAAAGAMPPASPAEFAAILATIERTGGNIHPIVALESPDGQLSILDGVHRRRACQELGVPCTALVYRVAEWSNLDPEEVSTILNASRRELPEAKRAILAARSITSRRGRQPQTGGIPPITREQAARNYNVSMDSLKIAIRLISSGREDLVARIMNERLSLNAARLEAKFPRGTSTGPGEPSPGPESMALIEPGADVDAPGESPPDARTRRQEPTPSVVAPDRAPSSGHPNSAPGAEVQDALDEADEVEVLEELAEPDEAEETDGLDTEPEHQSPSELAAAIRSKAEELSHLTSQLGLCYDMLGIDSGDLEAVARANQLLYFTLTDLFRRNMSMRFCLETRGLLMPPTQEPGISNDPVVHNVHLASHLLKDLCRSLPGKTYGSNTVLDREDARLLREAKARLNETLSQYPDYRAGKVPRRSA